MIFNTSLDSPHDPIYACDPRKFGVDPDSNIPVVLCYNLSHYENLIPSNKQDTDKTVNLVEQYLGGQYVFGRKDLPRLLSSESEKSIDSKPENTKEEEKGVSFHKFQQSLPNHLKGRRTSEMDRNEKKEYNSIRKNLNGVTGLEVTISVIDDIQDDVEFIVDHDNLNDKKREYNRRMKQLSRGRETSSKREQRKQANAKSMAAKRGKETPRERKERNQKNAKSIAAKRRKETPEESKERKRRNAKSLAAKKAKDTPEERKERKQANAKSMTEKRANEIPDHQYDARKAKKVFSGQQIVKTWMRQQMVLVE